MAVSKAPPETPVVEAPKSIDLELVLYQRYHRGGKLYERDNAYRFNLKSAEILLAEVEDGTGRPVWRRYKPKPVVKRAIPGVKEVFDATANNVHNVTDPDHEVVTQAINIGDDNEITEILGAPDIDDGVAV
jgi:hypothetical protein